MHSSNKTLLLGVDHEVIDVHPAESFDEVVQGKLDQARTEAHAQGAREGLESAAQLVQEAVEGMESQYAAAEEAIARGAVEIGLEIARHLLKIEVEAGNYDIEKIVRETLRESRVGRDACVVHLHPKDIERLEGIPFRTGTSLQADDGVPPGEVQVESALGCIVQDIDRALESISERLRGDLAG